METINNGKNLVDIELSANVSDNRRIDMNNAAEDYASVMNYRNDIEKVANRLLSLYPENDRDYYRESIDEQLSRLQKTIGELCEGILGQAAMQHERP